MRSVIFRASAVGFAFLLAMLLASPAYAGHETRDGILTDTGTDVIFVVLAVLVLVGAVVMLAAFAAVILMWERRDAEAERRSKLQGTEQNDARHVASKET